MRIQIDYISLILFSIFLFSCNKDEKPVEEKDRVIRFNPDIETLSKSVTGTEFRQGTEIGVFAVPHGADPAVGLVMKNVRFVLEGSSFVQLGTDNPVKYPQGGLDFYVYVPYSEQVANPLAAELLLGTDQQVDDVCRKSELFTAYTSEARETGETLLLMRRATCQILFKFEKRSPDTRIEFSRSRLRLPSKGIFNLKTGELLRVSDFEYFAPHDAKENSLTHEYELFAFPGVEVNLNENRLYFTQDDIERCFAFPVGTRFTGKTHTVIKDLIKDYE